MDGRRPVSGRLRAISSAGRLVESVVSPPTGGWDLPRASVATWVLTHFCVIAVFGVPMVVAGLASSNPWAVLVIAVWLLVASGFCLRLSRLLIVSPPDTPLRLATIRRLPFELKLGFFAFLSYAAFLAGQVLGWFVVGGFLATLTLTVGLRLAGLDALAGLERPPLYYLRSVFSIGGVLAIGSLALVAIALFLVAGLIFGPDYRGLETTVGEWLGVEWRRRGQLQALLWWLALTPAMALVCEAVSAVSRYEAGLNRRLADHERLGEREQIAQDLHDGEILSGLEELRRRSDDETQRKVISRLELRLRGLQIERNAIRGDRTLRSCLRQPLRGANLLDVAVDLHAEADVLDAMVSGWAASLVERLVMVQIGNSSSARAEGADLGIRLHPDHVLVTYIDNGGGFDPAVIEATGGGLSRVQYDIEHMNGALWYEQRATGTETTARIPRTIPGPGPGPDSDPTTG